MGSKSKPAKDRCSLLIWDVPKEVKGRFKAACAKRGRSMKSVLVNFMCDYINRHDV